LFAGGRAGHRRSPARALRPARRPAPGGAVGRQPAEGGAGEVDGDRAGGAAARRAHPRPGRAGQERRAPGGARAGRGRQGHHRLQLGERRDRGPEPPGPGAAPGPGGRRAGPRRAHRQQHPASGGVMVRAKKELTMLGVLVVLAVTTALLNPSFLGADNLGNNVRHVSLISLFALGEAVVILCGGIDLSIGSVICLSSMVTSYLAVVQGLGIGTAALLALALSVAIGFAQGAVIAWLGVQPFVVTLGSMLLLRGAAEVLTGGAEIGFQGRFPGFRFLGEGSGLGLPMPFWFALAAMAIVAF